MPHVIGRFWHGDSWLKKIGYSQMERRDRDWLTRVMGVADAQQFWKLGPLIGVIHHSKKAEMASLGVGPGPYFRAQIMDEKTSFWNWCPAVYDHGPHTKEHPALLCSPPCCGWRMSGPLRNTSLPLVSATILRYIKTILQHLLNPHCLHQVRFKELLFSPKPCSTSQQSLSGTMRSNKLAPAKQAEISGRTVCSKQDSAWH